MAKLDDTSPFRVQMREAERSIIAFAIECGVTVKKASQLLGISPAYLSERAKDLGMKMPATKPGPKPGSKPNRKPKPEAGVPKLRVVNGEEELEDEGLDDDDDDDDDDDLDEDEPDEEDAEPEDAVAEDPEDPKPHPECDPDPDPEEPSDDDASTSN